MSQPACGNFSGQSLIGLPVEIARNPTGSIARQWQLEDGPTAKRTTTIAVGRSANPRRDVGCRTGKRDIGRRTSIRGSGERIQCVEVPSSVPSRRDPKNGSTARCWCITTLPNASFKRGSVDNTGFVYDERTRGVGSIAAPSKSMQPAEAPLTARGCGRG